MGVDLGEKEEELGVDMSKIVVSYMTLSKYKYILLKRKREKSPIEFWFSQISQDFFFKCIYLLLGGRGVCLCYGV